MIEESAVSFKCPACGRYIGSSDGAYFESVPCKNCGTKTTLRIDRDRLRKSLRERTVVETT